MQFPNYFADANAPMKDAAFVIFGVPYDQTSSFRRGSAQAPGAIRQASWNFETYNVITGVDLGDISIHDYGDVEVSNCRPEQMVNQVQVFVSSLLEKEKFPVAMGGEHAITPGIIKAFPKDIAVLSLDAHMDFRECYDKEPFNHACVIRRIADHITIDNIAVLGIRSAEKEEFELAQQQNLFFLDAFTMQQKGIAESLKTTEEYLQTKKIYLTLDIDVIDPAYAPGTSTPEPFGLSPMDLLPIFDRFSKQLVGFDIVEVCPPFDHGETALLAAKLMRWLIGVIWERQQA